MLDVLIAGAGPAGSIAALVLARAGARVLVVDRETFPRPKLCGDTLNPGAIRLLASLNLRGGPLDSAKPLAGMIVTGLHGRRVEARYPNQQVGLAMTRADLDWWLLGKAIAAGARFEPGLIARKPLIDNSSGRALVRGLSLDRRGVAGESIRMPATMTIAADGRHSTIARSLGLASTPPRPRRWAFGVYATDVDDMSDLGEMHVRANYYFGVAPLAGGLSNICVVTGPRPGGRSPIEIVRRALAEDTTMAARFARARFEGGVKVLGPLAVNARAAGVEGLLLAGDAAGFVDPLTGDGLSLAMRGAQLAAFEALRTLEHGDFAGAVTRLGESRRQAFRSKLRFNRMVRRLVDSPIAIELAGWGAAVAPGFVRARRLLCRGRGVNTVGFAFAVIVGLLLAETRVSWRNERLLRARGAVEPPGDVHWVLAVLYPAAFMLMGVEGLYRAAQLEGSTIPAGPPGPSWFVSGALLFAASKALKYWAIRTLGERWSFRVLVLPGVPLVSAGPYQYVRHPNYIAVVGELVGAAMMVGARVTGPVMLALFGIALWARVRFEERALGTLPPAETRVRPSDGH